MARDANSKEEYKCPLCEAKEQIKELEEHIKNLEEELYIILGNTIKVNNA